jgi:hypothetical protein
MGDTDINKVFIDDGTDPFNDPRWKAAKPAKPKRTAGLFYHCPEAWADAAALVAGQHLILALRLYRRWRKRKPGTDTIVISAYALDGPGHSRRGRQRVVARLEEAGLIEVVKRGAGQAPRVRVIDPATS